MKARHGQSRYSIVFACEVRDSKGLTIPLTKTAEGVYAWGTDADDALRRAEDALSSLIDAENEGEIPRRDPVAEEE